MPIRISCARLLPGNQLTAAADFNWNTSWC